MAGTTKLEKLGKPGVFIACNTFIQDAKSASHDNAMPTVRIRTISSAEFYRLRGSVNEIRPMVEAVFEDLIYAIINPLTNEELNPIQEKKDEIKPTEITITSESFSSAFEEFNQQFLEKHWGDGLPLVPPTLERVKWMLTGTNRSPEEVLGKIKPKQGVATVEKVAINAVMAGAKPEYLPVIIAAIEALTDENFDHLHVLASAGSFSLLIVVSGPIAKEIKMESGIGFLGHGWRANNTIGRTIRLSTINIGQTWPGVNDMALTGRVSPHTFYTFAENAELSVWPSYPTTRGFKAEDSCVTVASIGGVGPTQNFYGGMIGTWTAQDIVDNIVSNILRTDRRSLSTWGSKGVGAVLGSGQGARNHMIILFPELVKELNKLGYNQESLQKEIYRRTTIRYEDLSETDRKSIQKAIEMGIIPPERRSVFEEVFKPGGMVPILISPEDIHLFVSGGVPGCAFSFSYLRIPPYNRTAIMTRLVTGATLTKAGTTDTQSVHY